MSPVALIETIRMLILMHDPPNDVISYNDIGVTFLQAHGYDPEDKRHVSYKAHRESSEHDIVFELRGPLHGQRVASKQWYQTLASWLCDRVSLSVRMSLVCS